MSSFDFDVGDVVLVRVREHGTSGKIKAKFEAECTDITNRQGAASPVATFSLPWGRGINSTRLTTYEAEFEVVDDA